MRPALLFLVLATPMAAAADVIHLSDGQVVAGVVRSCQGGDIVIEPPASAAVLLKIADVASGEGPAIERCLGGRIPDPTLVRGKPYGGQIVVAESSSILLLALGGGIGSRGLVYTSLAGLVVSPAILHGLHGNGGRAAASLGIHLALGLGGTLLGAAVTSGGEEECCAGAEVGAVIGFLVSQVIATTIDVFSFAYQEAPSRFAIGALLGPAERDPRAVRKPLSGLQLSLRF
jgi:hypothetical protein